MANQRGYELFDGTKKELIPLGDYLQSEYKSLKVPASLKGKKVYTESAWADIKGLFPATLIDVWKVKIGSELIDALRNLNRYYPENGIYDWMVINKIYIEITMKKENNKEKTKVRPFDFDYWYEQLHINEYRANVVHDKDRWRERPLTELVEKVHFLKPVREKLNLLPRATRLMMENSTYGKFEIIHEPLVAEEITKIGQKTIREMLELMNQNLPEEYQLKLD